MEAVRCNRLRLAVHSLTFSVSYAQCQYIYIYITVQICTGADGKESYWTDLICTGTDGKGSYREAVHSLPG